jgi:uncharacterized protein (DUF427 family)
MQASWNGRVIASSDDIVTVEGNAYFPADSLDPSYVRESSHRSVCGWKGEAHYYDLVVDDKVNANAVWYYPEPKEAASNIRGRVAFWKGVTVAAGPQR